MRILADRLERERLRVDLATQLEDEADDAGDSDGRIAWIAGNAEGAPECGENERETYSQQHAQDPRVLGPTPVTDGEERRQL